MSKSSLWPPRTKPGAFRMVEGGLDRTLQAEIRDVVEEQRWAHFITRRNAENDATHKALRARQRSKSPWRVFAFRRWTVDVQGIAIADKTGRWKCWVELQYEDGQWRHLLIMPSQERTFPTRARAEDVGSIIARAWIDFHGEEDQFKSKKRRPRRLTSAGELNLSLEEVAARLKITPDAMKRWLRRQLDELGSN
jgi:hypothetical protein